MSRLNFAPKIDEIKVTDIKNGLGVFTPKPDKPVSFAALRTALKKDGYTLASAEITVDGRLCEMIQAGGSRLILQSSALPLAVKGR